MKKQITVDLETLGRGESAFFVQIAAVEFDKDGNILDSFERNILFDEYQKYNFTMDIPTFAWWINQSREAQNSVFSNSLDRVTIKTALVEFEEWILSKGECNIWQHSTFDAPKITYAINEVLKHDQKIKYHWWKDIRTLTETTGIQKSRVTGIAHNALDDCINQAHYITKCLKQVN